MSDEENGYSCAVEANNEPVSQPPTQPVSGADGNEAPSPKGAVRLVQDIKAGEIWLIVVQAATLVVGMIVAYIYYGQLQQRTAATQAAAKSAQVASDAFETSQSQFDRSMVQVIHQTAAEIRAADAANESVKTTQEQMRLDQRAWVGVHDFKLVTFDVGERSQVNIVLSNSGKTPALDVEEGAIGDDFIPTTEASNKVTQEILKRQSGVAFSPAPVMPPQGQHYIILTSPNILTTDQHDSVLNGSVNEYIVGKVTYADNFKRNPWITFCFDVHRNIKGWAG